MNRTTKILAPVLFALCSPAFAVQNVGNGGAVAKGTCDGFDPTLLVTEVLDFYEVRHLFQIAPDLGPMELNVSAKVEMALDRLARLDPDRAETYRGWFRSFDEESRDHEPLMPFPPLKDAGDTSRLLRSGCHLEKIIDQSEPTSTISNKRYLIRRQQFESLDNDSKAGLILHELFYRDAIARGHATSIKARIMTGLFASKEVESWTLERYVQVMTEYGMNGYLLRYASVPFLLRYFDHEPLTQAAATAFCAALPGDSALVSLYELDITFDSERVQLRESMLGRHIVGEDGSGSVTLWLKDGRRLWDNDTVLGEAPAGPDVPLPFLCRQEVVKSPWTVQN